MAKKHQTFPDVPPLASTGGQKPNDMSNIPRAMGKKVKFQTSRAVRYRPRTLGIKVK